MIKGKLILSERADIDSEIEKQGYTRIEETICGKDDIVKHIIEYYGNDHIVAFDLLRSTWSVRNNSGRSKNCVPHLSLKTMKLFGVIAFSLIGWYEEDTI